jgi:hypothetical protein
MDEYRTIGARRLRWRLRWRLGLRLGRRLRWRRRGIRPGCSEDLRILEGVVSFIDPLKLLLGSFPQLGIGLKSIRMPYAHKVFVGLPDLLPRGIRGNA